MDRDPSTGEELLSDTSGEANDGWFVVLKSRQVHVVLTGRNIKLGDCLGGGGGHI